MKGKEWQDTGGVCNAAGKRDQGSMQALEIGSMRNRQG